MHAIAKLIVDNLSLNPWGVVVDLVALVVLLAIFVFALVAFVPV